MAISGVVVVVLKANVRGRPGTDMWAPERRKQAHFDEAHPREELPYAFPPPRNPDQQCSTYRGKAQAKVAETTTVIVSAAVSHVLFFLPNRIQQTISDEGTSCFAGEHERQGEARQTV